MYLHIKCIKEEDMRRMKKIVTVLMALSLTVTGMLGSGMTAKADSCGGLAEEDVYTPGEDEVIKDPLLHWAIRASMNAIKSNVKLTADMVGDKSVRNISFELCSHADDFADWTKPYWIENLEGIQYAKSATMVDIGYTSAIEGKSIKDLSPLSALTQLDILILKQDGITDVSALKTLVNLSQLDRSSCITSVRPLFADKASRYSAYSRISPLSPSFCAFMIPLMITGTVIVLLLTFSLLFPSNNLFSCVR